MGFIYSISDIHGNLEPLEIALSKINLNNKEDKLILLGDYIDRGPKSLETIIKVKNISEKYKNQVVVLMGNHEDNLLQFLNIPNMDLSELKRTVSYKDNMKDAYKILKQFLTIEEVCEIEIKTILLKRMKKIEKKIEIASEVINSNHKDLIKWIENLTYFYETKNQIYVHAGINENHGIEWKKYTTHEECLWKRKIKPNKFIKDIISGHTPTIGIEGNNSKDLIYWDKTSHYFIDGSANKTGFVQILRYDVDNDIYEIFNYEKEIYERIK